MPDMLENPRLKEVMYTKTLSCGLTCYVFPKPGFVQKQAMLAVNYGSAQQNFEYNGKIIKTPEGVAHFLEHKVFEDNELDYFEEFTKLGASVNAFTSFNITSYYCNCSNNFKNSLELLFDMVQTPYFTEENVEKEKGIIEAEINMNGDNPSWKAFFNMQQGLYAELAIKDEIAGTSQSIAQINMDTLYRCYNAFYTPSNMALIVVGDVDPEEVYKIARSKVPSEKKPTAKILYPNEPANAKLKYSEISLAISKPQFCLGFKDITREDKANDLAATKIMLDIIIGESSELYRELYTKGLLDNDFSLDYANGASYGTGLFSGNSKDPQTVYDAILNEIDRLKNEGIEKQVFERLRSKHRGRYIRGFNSISQITGMQADFFSKGFHVFDLMDSFENMNAAACYNRLENHFGEKNHCLSIVKMKN